MNTTIGTLIGAAVWVVCQGLGLAVMLAMYEMGEQLLRWMARKISWHR